LARRTADTKGKCTFHLKALQIACMNCTEKLPVNVKVLIEAKKEVGSVSLWDFVAEEQRKAKKPMRCRFRIRRFVGQRRAIDYL